MPGEDRLKRLTPLQLRWVIDNVNVDNEMMEEASNNSQGKEGRTSFKADDKVFEEMVKKHQEKNNIGK